MDIEELAKILHDGNKKAVEQGSVLSRKKCTYIFFLTEPVEEGECYACIDGNLYHTFKKQDQEFSPATLMRQKCPRCHGSGFEPFLSWEELTGDAREGRRIQAEHVNEIVILPLENEIHEMEERIRQLNDELKKYKAMIPIT